MQRTWLLAALILAAGVRPALADPATGVIKDRATFMPSRNYAALPGKAVGILLDGKHVTALDHWSGPADLLVFSVGGHSYRKTYVPTAENPQITNFSVPVGTEGKRETYPALAIASPRSVIPWGVTARYSLVEVEVNGGMGSPAQDCFVATNFKVLDGTKAYPLKVADAIADVQKRYAERAAAKDIEKAMADAAKQALGDKSPTGPREKSDLMYVTWLPESATLQVRFRTKLSDGVYTIKDNPVPKFPRLPPRRLPPQPAPPGGAAGGGAAGGGAAGGGAAAGARCPPGPRLPGRSARSRRPARCSASSSASCMK